jgi:hypothetical protein
MKIKFQWREHDDRDAGGNPYQGRDKLYQTPAGHTGGPWPSDIRDHYRKIEEEKK